MVLLSPTVDEISVKQERFRQTYVTETTVWTGSEGTKTRKNKEKKKPSKWTLRHLEDVTC